MTEVRLKRAGEVVIIKAMKWRDAITMDSSGRKQGGFIRQQSVLGLILALDEFDSATKEIAKNVEEELREKL